MEAVPGSSLFIYENVETTKIHLTPLETDYSGCRLLSGEARQRLFSHPFQGRGAPIASSTHICQVRSTEWPRSALSRMASPARASPSSM